MKKFKTGLVLGAIVIAAMVSATACNNSESSQMSSDTTTRNNANSNNMAANDGAMNNNGSTATNNDGATDNSIEKDARFMMKAAQINMEEIALGKLAQQKGNTAHLKELGKMMETDHTKASAELMELAKSKSVTLPLAASAEAMDVAKTLSQKSGNDFGKAYSDMMVNGHKDAIALFTTASNESSDASVKAFADKMLPAFKTHLEHSLMCQKECEKM